MTGRRWYTPWLFLAPALLIAATFSIGPFANTAVLAFTNAKALGGGHFTGLANFIRMGQDDTFWLAMGNTALYVVVCVPLLVTLPLLLALLVQRQVPGIGFFRAVFYSPVVASMVVVGLVWTWLLQSDGLVNWVLQSLQVISGPLPFLTDAQLLLFSAMFVTVWKGLGYYMVVYLAALANVPAELHEAAALDGAGEVRRFWSITVPTIRSTMLLVGILSVIASAKVFAEIYVMSNGSGGPGGQSQSLVFRIRDVGLGLAGETGYASAMSLVLFICTVGFSIIFFRMSRER
ncbi:carbohydrate ABC transporter permease [Kribbella italica]|uniref:Multiple sugar transport system permease protein n=1 Tax=Kribbella italica TaxID=1540520 RepID=A0A7W9J1F5_9ACTN|nr:sugar ABC transporter permease [Kribbella italica]MBB5833307.1 multiple sugar transport system permease protein [Kribbella italica]